MNRRSGRQIRERPQSSGWQPFKRTELSAYLVPAAAIRLHDQLATPRSSFTGEQPAEDTAEAALLLIVGGMTIEWAHGSPIEGESNPEDPFIIKSDTL